MPPMISRTTGWKSGAERRVEVDQLAVGRSRSGLRDRAAAGHDGRRPSGTRAGPGATASAGRSSSSSHATVRRRGRAARDAARRRSGAAPPPPRRARGGAAAARAVTRVTASAVARPDGHGGGRRVLREHVQRLAAATPRPRRCPTVKSCWPSWRAELAPVDVHDAARACAAPGAPCRRRKARLPSPAAKQRSWLSRLSATGSPAVARELAHGVLGQRAEREREPLEQLRLEPGEHVALVLARVRARRQERPVLVARDARVVAGGEPGRAERAGERQHRVEAHLAVAAHARVGRAPPRRSRSGSRPPPRRGSARAGRASRAGCPCGGPARARPARRRGEQQLRSPSVAGSDHSSSVTATTSSPASSASCAAAALSTPPLIATSVRRGLAAQAAARRRGPRRRARGAARRPRARRRAGPRAAARRARRPRRPPVSARGRRGTGRPPRARPRRSRRPARRRSRWPRSRPRPRGRPRRARPRGRGRRRPRRRRPRRAASRPARAHPRGASR